MVFTFDRKEVTKEFRFKPGLFGKIIIEQKVVYKTYKGMPPRLDRDLGKPIEVFEKWVKVDYNDLINQNLINVVINHRLVK